MSVYTNGFIFFVFIRFSFCFFFRMPRRPHYDFSARFIRDTRLHWFVTARALNLYDVYLRDSVNLFRVMECRLEYVLGDIRGRCECSFNKIPKYRCKIFAIRWTVTCHVAVFTRWSYHLSYSKHIICVTWNTYIISLRFNYSFSAVVWIIILILRVNNAPLIQSS